MNKGTKLMIAALCALLMAGSVSAAPPQKMKPEPAPVAGYSPNFADPQPKTGPPLASLTTDANRLIRWQGWLDIDAFSTSVLNQMQKQLNEGEIQAGAFTIADPAIAAAVAKAEMCNDTFVMNELLNEGLGEIFQEKVTLYCWLYRHNFVDTGLYQLYISAKGKMLIGEQLEPEVFRTPPQPNKDIQGLAYEFGSDRPGSGMIKKVWRPVFADVEIWRGAVVRVDATGAISIVGNEAGVVTDKIVEEAPMSDWEKAPSLINNPHYNPKCATGAGFVEPLDRAKKINGNDVQTKAGSTQNQYRVRTFQFFRFR